MSYFGGKNGAGVAERLINAIPPHRVLFVPFAGHCAVTRKIQRCYRTIVCDLDPDVIDWWPKHFDDVTSHQSNGIEALRNYCQFNDLLLEPSRDLASLSLPRRDTFVFADPPYPHETRGSTRYPHEMNDDDHEHLLKTLTSINCNVMVCTYDNDLYRDMLQGWEKFTYESMTRGGTMKTETAYCNYDFESCELHDYRYLGKNKREREKLSRREKNLINRIKEMPDRERMRYLRRIEMEFFSRSTSSPDSATDDRESVSRTNLQSAHWANGFVARG